MEVNLLSSFDSTNNARQNLLKRNFLPFQFNIIVTINLPNKTLLPILILISYSVMVDLTFLDSKLPKSCYIWPCLILKGKKDREKKNAKITTYALLKPMVLALISDLLYYTYKSCLLIL